LASISSPAAEIVIVFDEFDRMTTAERRLFPDTIKDLSDNSINATLVLVGVARDVMDLIVEHGSVDRCLSQIRMPPMTKTELRTIISKALEAMKMQIEAHAIDLILLLSQGFPHYTHLLGQESSLVAIRKGKWEITSKDLSDAIPAALEHAQQTVRDEYYKASEGQRQGTLYPQVLLACALAEPDELGFFKSTSVRGTLRDITNKEYEIPNFSQHLKKFSTDVDRGPVLERSGSQRRYKFRFRNAML
jgi:predicted nuclease of predicted toxin-antitoxin system